VVGSLWIKFNLNDNMVPPPELSNLLLVGWLDVRPEGRDPSGQ
jgi:hypothetical protein